jgi:hypothetical protein
MLRLGRRVDGRDEHNVGELKVLVRGKSEGEVTLDAIAKASGMGLTPSCHS